MSRSNYDVIISGGGPVGLFLACELALAKCAVLVLEKSDDPSSPLKRLPFGIRGLSSTSIEALDRRGLLTELEIHKNLKSPHKAAPTKPGTEPRRQGGHFAGIPFLDSDIDSSQWKYRLPSSTTTNLISEIQELETTFTRRAEALGVDIRRGHPVTSFEQTRNGVTVHCGDQSLQSQWLVGCDGARSIVRKLGGFDFAGTEPKFTGYTLSIDVADPEKLGAGRISTLEGMYMQSQPGYVLMQDFDGGAFHSSEQPLTLEHVQKTLRRISGTDVTITALHTATTWTDRARQATKYRHDRILLAGDAAHIHSPLGGQGLNLGLGDAMNLGWKLAATIHKTAPTGLLDTYETERQPVGQQVLEWSRAQVAIMQPTPEGRALNSILRDLVATRDGATYFAARVWGLFTKYDLGSDNDLVGRTAPNFQFEDGTTVGERLRDGHGLLIDFTANTSLEHFARELGGKATYVTSGAKETQGQGALLVRPDGIVAWASEQPESDVRELQEAVRKWF